MIFLLLGQASALPFFSLSSFVSLPVSLPFLSSPIKVGPYSSPSLPSIPFPSHANYNVKNYNYHNPLVGVGNGCVQIRLRVNNALLHKLGFVQPPYLHTPGVEPVEVSCRMCLALLFDKLNTVKMHGLDTSKVSSRVET